MAQEPVDSVHQLREVQVTAPASAATAVTRADGTVRVNAAALGKTPQLFGEADPLRYLQLASGVSSISDYSSGMAIDGMDYSQNSYSVGGVPVQFPYHFGGVFSTFNSDHYPELIMTRSAHPAGSTDCLGGLIEVRPATGNVDGVQGNINVGMLATQGHVAVQPAQRWRVDVSGRISYIDALYGDLLSTGDDNIRYNFHDFDVGVRYDAGVGTLRGTFHSNRDHIDYADGDYAMDNSMRWSNTLGGLMWQSAGLQLNVYYSDMRNRLTVAMEQFDLSVVSKISQYGGSGRRIYERDDYSLYFGASFDGYSYLPQWVERAGVEEDEIKPGYAQNAYLWKAFVEGTVHLCNGTVDLTFGIDVNQFSGVDGYHATHGSPRFSALWHYGSGTVGLHVSNLYQYIHQAGLSEIGMASNFKFGASADCLPQRGWNFALSASQRLPWAITADCEVYYKRLVNQPEYQGGMFDLLNDDYNAVERVFTCSGYNVGGNVSLRRSYGALTAMANYSYGIARRCDPATGQSFTATSDIRHCFNACVAYDLNARWNVNAVFSLASGRAITPIKAVYMIGERVMMEYGPRNSGRLPMRHRLDLGASYCFGKLNGRVRHKVSLSVINAYGHRNAELSTYGYHSDRNTYGRKLRYSLFRFLPSLSYSISF